MPSRVRLKRSIFASALSALLPAVLPFAALGQSTVETLPATVVTGTRVAQDPHDVPMAIDVVGAETLRDQTLQVNLSESLQRVPGINVQNRGNYAQDLQISSRGFGARASFGVRGIKLITDGIPASQPDGQGQVSHFALGSADRVEVLRGPFSVLYGNASGGVMQIFTESAPRAPFAHLGLAFGDNDTERASLRTGGRMGDLGLMFDASRFSTDGIRPQSAASKKAGNLKLRSTYGATQFTLIANTVDMNALDAQGLTRAEFDANPDQTSAAAITFNTRKSTRQSQIGAKVEHTLSNAQSLEFTVYGGDRSVTQWQSIPVATQTAATQPGGVIDFARSYGGVDAKWALRQAWGSLVVGVNYDNLDEDRRGYENFIGTTLGVTGRLRREEGNRVRNKDVYAQGEFKVAPWVSVTAGVRHSDVDFKSQDYYVIAGRNPDDSGAANFKKTTPAVGIVFKTSMALRVYASAGRGFETPTFNELSYRAGSATGLNFELKPAVSDSVELGAKWRAGAVRANAAIFQTETKNEIVTLTNAGGRSAFQNAGSTTRTGGELSLTASVGSQLEFTTALTSLRATYDASFKTCGAPPCTTPTVVVAAGNKLPGLPGKAAFAEMKWTHPFGATVAAEIKHQGKVFVNDTNTDAATAYTIGSVRAGYRFERNAFAIDLGARIDNVTDKRYAGTVIVNEGNSRFFETAPGRSWLATIGITAKL